MQNILIWGCRYCKVLAWYKERLDKHKYSANQSTVYVMEMKKWNTLY